MSDTASTDTGTADTSTTDTSTETETTTKNQATDTDELAAVVADLGLEPGQLAERLRASRKWEERAKANVKAAEELEEFRKQSMSETERAIEEARTEGRKQALTEAGSKIAAAEVRAAAVGRMSAEQVDTLIDGINLARFIDDDGEVDRDAVTQFMDGIAPLKDDTAPSPLDLGQGNRGTGAGPAKTDMDSLLRAAVNGRI